MNAGQETGVFIVNATEQKGFIPTLQRKLTQEGGEVSEETSGKSSRSEVRNAVDGSTSDE